MRAIMLMFDSLNRRFLPPYGDTLVDAPNFARLAERTVTFDTFYAGSLPCMPARREMHTGRHNFLHRSWGPLEPFDDSMPELLGRAGVHTHLATDHFHYWEDGGATYHGRYTTYEQFRGQDGDPWKGVVDADVAGAGFRARTHRQDEVNRAHMPTAATHSQTLTVDAGLDFIRINAAADRWMLQLELFDPHEPFFAHEEYTSRYGLAAGSSPDDWPPYAKVTESDDAIDRSRRHYAALLTMCDESLGRVLDAMDEHDLWDDTLLIVNTDHGLLLSEHGWWGKNVQPWFDELVHLPMFMWDPRTGERGTRRDDLAQTIDLAPTLLRCFGVEPTPDMRGRDLSDATNPLPPRAGALFGSHGAHVNVTDGRYVYMRASATPDNQPLEEFTLMPAHMRSRFGVDELAAWEPADPFAFTKGLRTMRTATRNPLTSAWLHGTLLFDLERDPGQTAPIVDDAIELRMLRLLARLLRESDAPASQYTRLGIPEDAAPGEEHLLVRVQRERATAMAEPMPASLPPSDLLAVPAARLLRDPLAARIVDRHAPGLASTELLALPAPLTLTTIASMGGLTASALTAIAEEFAQVEADHAAPTGA